MLSKPTGTFISFLEFQYDPDCMFTQYLVSGNCQWLWFLNIDAEISRAFHQMPKRVDAHHPNHALSHCGFVPICGHLDSFHTWFPTQATSIVQSLLPLLCHLSPNRHLSPTVSKTYIFFSIPVTGALENKWSALLLSQIATTHTCLKSITHGSFSCRHSFCNFQSIGIDCQSIVSLK